MLTEDQIQFLNQVCPNYWTENTGLIIVYRSIVIPPNMNLTKIPVHFEIINGYLYCRSNLLTSLEGCPRIIKRKFNCDDNQLTSLEGGPKEVGEYYSCSDNQLTNLIGAPEVCYTDFWCNSNQLTSLEGCPRIIKNSFKCNDNPNLHILYGIGRVDGLVYYDRVNDLNEWIISRARANIFVSYKDIAKWIKRNNRLEILLKAQQEIRQYFSPNVLHLVDSGMYNESRILDYKKFSRLC